MRRRGFTMVELMIAMAIAMFVVAGLYGVFTLQSRQFLFQDLQMEMHQNLRFATDILSRSVRMAGYNTSGLVTGYLGDPSEGDPLPAMIAWDGDGSDQTDAITVVFGDPSLTVSTTMLSVKECGTTSLPVLTDMLDFDDRMAEYDVGELLLCMDYAGIGGMESYLWVLTGSDASSGTITELQVASNSGYADYAAVCPDDENLTPVMSCSLGQVYTFYIDNTDDSIGPGTPDHPVLMMDTDFGWPESDDVPLVDNIEDLQVALCIDDGTDTVDCSESANWVGDDDDAELDMAAGDIPWMVRISLVVRSSRQDPNRRHAGLRPALENHAAGVTADHYYRQTLSTEVAVRNLRVQSVM